MVDGWKMFKLGRNGVGVTASAGFFARYNKIEDPAE